MARVPILYNDRDTFLHQRDPRSKLILFGLLVVLLYVAPTWTWMLGLTVLGLLMAAVARVPPKWLGVLWLLQVPNVIGLLVIPAAGQLFAGDFSLTGNLLIGLKLSLAWSAALFVSISLFTTMRVDELADGLRGLHLPEVVCFTVEYTFLLMYLSVNDIFRVADAMKLKGVNLETRNPVRLMRNLPWLIIPAIFTIVRRASTMMSVLQMRGFSFTARPDRELPSNFGVADATLVAGGIAVFSAALADRLGVIQLLPLHLLW